jgi:hypothetical protein
MDKANKVIKQQAVNLMEPIYFLTFKDALVDVYSANLENAGLPYQYHFGAHFVVCHY